MFAHITDIDECVEATHDCHANADCTDTDGSFICSCKVGFTGNGLTCTGTYIHISTPTHTKCSIKNQFYLFALFKFHFY